MDKKKSLNMLKLPHGLKAMVKVPQGKWADLGGTAMPSQPVSKPEQAPELSPLAKISLISKEAHGPRIRY